MHRLFAALPLPPDITDTLLDTMDGIEGARWQSEEQLHVTLRFAGELDPRQGEDLVTALSRVESPAFDLELRGVGHFERKGRPHTLWAGIAPSEPLAVLQRRVERACRAAGLRPETRKFVPHVTLARLNSGSGPIGAWLADNALLTAGPWRVDGFALYESRLTPYGADYERLEDFAFD
ncbi:RNA 2',3'-cyclic phosphodiesterase [Pelagerythrobacter rhizovicinus]|uniref:RNA 2',3'-cyclic phosphodiesterase n=1 Tax=Pelagerythrobacter rhizovicinus TaxID=2268576 RepID=A0A4Q2KPL6_9SPHN|nr:RNA 2',3'-cyclic phosphodiesterase [Pelagerythrobacter rhizovicinus]RXZ66467.1 RNA 2',3'-cyclic phosphodiesterase [Pelagerythrobacter rhizovicinus]